MQKNLNKLLLISSQQDTPTPKKKREEILRLKMRNLRHERGKGILRGAKQADCTEQCWRGESSRIEQGIRREILGGRRGWQMPAPCPLDGCVEFNQFPWEDLVISWEERNRYNNNTTFNLRRTKRFPSKSSTITMFSAVVNDRCTLILMELQKEKWCAHTSEAARELKALGRHNGNLMSWFWRQTWEEVSLYLFFLT